MTVDELKEAWRTRAPVIRRDIRGNKTVYLCVSAIIYRRNEKNEIYIQVELTDKNANSIVIVAPSEVFPVN